MVQHGFWKTWARALTGIAGLAAQAFAQTDTPPVALDPFIVEARQAVWTVEPVLLRDAVTLDGTASGRGLTRLSETLLDTFVAGDVAALSTLAPGLNSPARFGNVSVPNIRGTAAEALTNGQRRSGNLFGTTPTFNSVEAVEILRGTPTVLVGAGKQTGGLVNWITKRATLDAQVTRLELQLGDWLPSGDSYAHARWQLDHNQPLSPTLALRISYEGQEDETFYNAVRSARDDHQDLYLTLTWKPSADTFLWLHLNHLWQARPQQLGVNRPSQALIDEGRYLPGVPDPDTAGFDPGLLTASDADAVTLPRNASLLSDGDNSNANASFAQLILEHRFAGLTYVQKTLLDRVDRHREHDFYYAETVWQFSGEQRHTLHWKGIGGSQGLLTSGSAGLSLRYEERENYANYWNEFAYAHDLSAGTVHRSAPDFTPGAVPGPGGRVYYTPDTPVFATPETSHSQLGQAAVFARQSAQWRGWTLTAGGRLDGSRARARNPLRTGPTSSTTAEAAYLNGSYELALNYSLPGGHELTLTHSLMHALGANNVGDGLNLYTRPGSDPNRAEGFLREEDFEVRSRLWEIGWIRTGDHVVTQLQAFFQERDRRDFFFVNDVLVKGVEASIEVPRLWHEHLRGGLHVTYLDARYADAAPAEFGGSTPANVYAPGTGPEGQGTGLGYSAGTLFDSVPEGDWRLPGLSRWSVQGRLHYGADTGLEAALWGDWQSAQPGNLRNTFEIPAQYTLNLLVGYAREHRGVRTQLRLYLYNVTDEENWIHNGDTFFDNLLIGRNLPRRLRAVFSVAF